MFAWQIYTLYNYETQDSEFKKSTLTKYQAICSSFEMLTQATFSETLLSMQIKLEWNYAKFMVKGN
jgi:hypothetical protein